MSDDTRILLAVRTGEASQAPATTAAWLATRLTGRVTLLHVATELQTAAQVAAGAGMDEKEVREKMIEEAKQRTDELARALLGDIPFDVVVSSGEVAEEVVSLAQEIGATLIVAGSQARGAIRSAILGDTTREILRHARCPVVVVPPGVGTD